MKYLLDTNILSDLVRNPRGPVARQIRFVGIPEVWTSLVVAGELRFGAVRRGATRLAAEIEELLLRLPPLPLESPADVVYSQIRERLERQGQPIGANDLWIAAHALSLNSILVTDNEAEFRRVEGLTVENWLR